MFKHMDFADNFIYKERQWYLAPRLQLADPCTRSEKSANKDNFFLNLIHVLRFPDFYADSWEQKCSIFLLTGRSICFHVVGTFTL